MWIPVAPLLCHPWFWRVNRRGAKSMPRVTTWWYPDPRSRYKQQQTLRLFFRSVVAILFFSWLSGLNHFPINLIFFYSNIHTPPLERLQEKTHRKNMWEVWHWQRRIGTAALQGHPYCDVNIEGSTAPVSPFPLYIVLCDWRHVFTVFWPPLAEQAPKITDACLYVVSNDLDLNFLLLGVYCTSLIQEQVSVVYPLL